MAKKKRAWKSQPSKTSPTFCQFYLQPFWFEYLELEKFVWWKVNCFGFLTQKLINLPNFIRKGAHMRDIIFLRQPINSATRQVLWRNKFNLLPKHPNRHDNYFFVWKRSLFGQIDFTKSKVKTWRFYARLFFFLYRKVVIIILKYKLSTLEGILFFFLYKKTSRSVGNRVFDQIKRERK